MVDVSIIIPTYNRLWCLPDAIQSCRRSACEVEIIVVDDGSTDGTWDWLQTQSDVRSFRQDNSGQDWSQNLGFSKATGEYVRFLDSDDLLPGGANDIQFAAAKSEGADVVVAGHAVCNEKLEIQREIPWIKCDDFIAQQLGECDSSHYSAYLLRREFVEDLPHRQEFAFREDRIFIIEVAIKGPRVAAVAPLCLLHREHSRSRVQHQAGLADAVRNWQHLELYRRADRLMRARGLLTPRRQRAMAKALWPVAHGIAYTHLNDACRVADWIFELDPDFRIPERGALGWLYRNSGFRFTERMLWVRRTAIRSIF